MVVAMLVVLIVVVVAVAVPAPMVVVLVVALVVAEEEVLHGRGELPGLGEAGLGLALPTAFGATALAGPLAQVQLALFGAVVGEQP